MNSTKTIRWIVPVLVGGLAIAVVAVTITVPLLIFAGATHGVANFVGFLMSVVIVTFGTSVIVKRHRSKT